MRFFVLPLRQFWFYLAPLFNANCGKHISCWLYGNHLLTERKYPLVLPRHLEQMCLAQRIDVKHECWLSLSIIFPITRSLGIRLSNCLSHHPIPYHLVAHASMPGGHTTLTGLGVVQPGCTPVTHVHSHKTSVRKMSYTQANTYNRWCSLVSVYLRIFCVVTKYTTQQKKPIFDFRGILSRFWEFQPTLFGAKLFRGKFGIE